MPKSSEEYETADERYRRIVGAIIAKHQDRNKERTRELTGEFRFADIELHDNEQDY